MVENEKEIVTVSYEEYVQLVEAEIHERKRLRDEEHSCPVCDGTTIRPLGGKPTCWWECRGCGSYSPMSPTWESALTTLPWNQDPIPGRIT